MPGVDLGDVRRRPARAGIASGVVNAMRQVGGALGIAIIGSVGATLTASRFHEHVAGLPPAAGADRLEPLVVGGRASLIADPRLTTPRSTASCTGCAAPCWRPRCWRWPGR